MILVTGGSGQLGTAFRRALPDAVFPSRHELDLADPKRLAARLARFSPTAVVNSAAYTAVDGAESEEELAHTVNAEAVGAMARYTAAEAIPFVTFSTDYVFSGTATTPYVESSPTAPINAYGRTKLAGERLALDAHPGALVVRTSWVISGTHPNFVATMLRLAHRGEHWRVVDDQVGCPTIVTDLVTTTLRALERGATGLLHLTNAGETTWHGLARAAVELAGGDPDLIEPSATSDYPTPARRPAYSVLRSERLATLGLDPLPDWRDSLPAVIAAQLARS